MTATTTPLVLVCCLTKRYSSEVDWPVSWYACSLSISAGQSRLRFLQSRRNDMVDCLRHERCGRWSSRRRWRRHSARETPGSMRVQPRSWTRWFRAATEPPTRAQCLTYRLCGLVDYAARTARPLVLHTRTLYTCVIGNASIIIITRS